MKRNKLYLAWMAAALLAMAGCSDEIGNNVQQGKPIEGDGVYMKVNIITSTSGAFTKAGKDGEDPTGGELGDGDLPGFEDENYIRSVSIIVYEGENINDPNATIVASGYQDQVINQGDEEFDKHHNYQATVLIKGGEDFVLGQQYRILAVTNANVTSQYPVGQTLQNVEDAQVTITRTPGESDGGFIMSSHQEKAGSEENTVTFTEESKTSENAVQATTWVERLSARIDYIGDKNEFDVKANGNDQPAANVTILDIAPVNVAIHPTYIFKRVTGEIKDDGDIDPGTSPITLLGNELPNDQPSTPSSHHAGLNYVIDPTFSQLGNKKFNNIFSKDLLQTIEDNSGNKELKFRSLAEIIAADPISVENNTGRERIICYTGENTMGAKSQTHGRTTGVIFKAQYEPDKLIVYNESNGTAEYKATDEIPDYEENKGFYRVNGKIYHDLAAAEVEFITSTTRNDDALDFLRKNFKKNTWDTGVTAEELKNALETIKNTEDLGYIQFLLGILNDEDVEIKASEMNWEAFLNSKVDNIFPTNGSKDNAKIEQPGLQTIEYYGPEHLCYYQYWIRHANNGDPKTMGIMEFCIVRNNVYQLAVTGVTGLGMPDPFDSAEKPDEGEEEDGYYLEVKLWVKDWVVRLNNNIILQ